MAVARRQGDAETGHGVGVSETRRQGGKETETGRYGHRETRRQAGTEQGHRVVKPETRNRETRRQEDTEARRHGDNETRRQGDTETGRQGGMEAGKHGRQRDMETNHGVEGGGSKPAP